jgi:hypothetical protein
VLNPGVEQDVARAAVEAQHVLPGREQAEVAEAADIEHRDMPCAIAEQCLVEGRYQGGALTAGGNVATTEVGDHADSGQFGEQSGVADLDGETACRLMAHGLAVAADGANLLRSQVLLLQKLIDGGGGQFDPLLFGHRRACQLVGARGAQCQQFAA